MEPRVRWADLELTEPAGGPSALAPEFPAGVYGQGLITLPTVDDARSLSESIEWQLDHDVAVVANNAFGDLFMRAPAESSIYYLWLQHGKGREIAPDVTRFERLLLDSPEDRGKFLETRAFEVVRSRLGPLQYGQVYTHVPILGLGGSGNLADCALGRLDVYISIVSQSI